MLNCDPMINLDDIFLINAVFCLDLAIFHTNSPLFKVFGKSFMFLHIILFMLFYLQVHALNLVQPNVPFLTIAEPSRWRVPVQRPEPMAITSMPDVLLADNVLLVPSSDVEVTTSQPIPPTIQQLAHKFQTDNNITTPTSAQVHNFMESLTISTEEQKIIHDATVKQSDSPLWKEFRSGLITASNIHHVHTKMKNTRTSDPQKLLQQLLNKSKFQGNQSTRYGHQYESKAARMHTTLMLKMHKNLQVHECGLTIHRKYPFIGASLDRSATCNCHLGRVVEIKCPASMKDKPKGSFLSLPYVKMDGSTYVLNTSHIYFSQVQCQMAVTDTSQADFVVWSPQEIIVISVQFNKSHWDNLQKPATTFFLHHLGPECSCLWEM